MIYDNLWDYLHSGTMGDDRRMSFYALLRGQVVRVNEAVVETHLPTRPMGVMKQRMRWAKSAFLGSPFVATNLRPLVMFFYFYPLIFNIAWPFSVVVLTTLWVRYDVPVLLYGVAFWWIVSVVMTTIYAAYRPSMSTKDKLIQWALGFVYPLFGLFLLRTSAYWALATLKDQGWATRGDPKAAVDIQPAPVGVEAVEEGAEAQVISIRRNVA
jgi:hyaluronan synthase